MTLFIYLLSTGGETYAQDENIKVARMRISKAINHDANPTIWNNKVVFNSDRRGVGLSVQLDSEGNYVADLWMAEIDTANNGNLGKPVQFEDLNTKKHEAATCFSSDGKTAVITRNIKAKNHTANADRYGIFFQYQDEDGYWSVPASFEHNSKNDEGYSVTAPALSPDGNTLVFYGNISGEYDRDLYICRLDMYGVWSKPEKMGPHLNTDKEEKFPSFDDEGNLYFSSNGYRKNTGFDIVVAKIKSDGTWEQAELMPDDINSKYDDLDFTTKDGSHAYFTSNRKGAADIYHCIVPPDLTPEFTDCKPNTKKYTCFLIYDDAIEVDDMPYRFEWQFDDGSKKIGKEVKVCNQEIGQFSFSLSLTDTVLNEVYKNVSDGFYEVLDIDWPFIVSKDKIKANETFKLSLTQLDLVPFDITEYYWIVNGKKVILGDNASYSFAEPGTYEIKVGVIGDPDKPKEKRCTIKEIIVE